MKDSQRRYFGNILFYLFKIICVFVSILTKPRVFYSKLSTEHVPIVFHPFCFTSAEGVQQNLILIEVSRLSKTSKSVLCDPRLI